MKKKAIISLILVLAMNLLLLKNIFIADALFMIPDEGEPWPQGTPNICENFSDTFIDFEDGMNIQLITSQNPGVKFSATEGLKWIYGDIRTGNYDVAPYGSQEFVANGNFFGWMEMLGNNGRIDFPYGANYFSVLMSASGPLFLLAYNINDTLLDNVFISENTNTGQFARLTVDAPENEKIAYVIISNLCSDDSWIIDDICTDALNVPYFSQCDKTWKNEIYDHTASTICRYGCALTSIAMILNYYGKAHGFQTNPKELNEWFKNYHLDVNKNGKRDYGEPTGYTRYGDVKWEVIPEYFKDKYGKKIISFNGRTNFNSEKETYSNFRKKNDIILNNDLINQRPVILKVPYSPWHFIVATSKFEKDNISTWAINDPGWKSRKDLFNSYNNNYYGLRRFGPRKKDNSIIVIRICSPVEVLVTAPDGKKLGIDSDGKEFNEILSGGYYIEDSLIEEGKSVKVIEILKPLDGNYALNVTSTGNGPYIIDYDGYDKSGKWIDSKTFEGDAVLDNENNLGEIFKYELNYSSQSAGGDSAYSFSDSEIAENNLYEAETLNFVLPQSEDFSSLITPSQNSTRTIAVENSGSLDFTYKITTEFISGILCGYLTLQNINGEIQPLLSFESQEVNFPDKSTWEFTAALDTDDSFLKNQTCEFNFIFEGTQDDSGDGFSDTEKVFNMIFSGDWNNGVDPYAPEPGDVVINEVYYDVDENHGTEGKNEWIELYNNTDQDIQLKNWTLTDNANTKTINSKITILAKGFALVSHNASTWNYWDTYLAEIINLGGSKAWLNNSGDQLSLKDSSGVEIDFVAWGKGHNNVYPEWSIEAEEGESIARKEKGVDTNSVNDWEILSVPNPGTNPHMEFSIYETENKTDSFSGENGNEQDNSSLPALPVDEEDPMTKEIIITKKIILGDDEKIIPDDDGDGDDDSNDDKNDKEEKSFSSSISNFVDSVQPPDNY